MDELSFLEIYWIVLSTGGWLTVLGLLLSVVGVAVLRHHLVAGLSILTFVAAPVFSFSLHLGVEAVMPFLGSLIPSQVALLEVLPIGLGISLPVGGFLLTRCPVGKIEGEVRVSDVG